MTGNALKRAREELEAFEKRYPHIVAWWKEVERKIKSKRGQRDTAHAKNCSCLN